MNLFHIAPTRISHWVKSVPVSHYNSLVKTETLPFPLNVPVYYSLN